MFFSPDGGRILSRSTDQTLRLWDARTGTAQLTLADKTIRVRACAFSPDGERVVSAAIDKTLRLWDATTGRQLWEYALEGTGTAAAWSPRGTELAAGDSLGHLLILRLQNFPFGSPIITAWESNPGSSLSSRQGKQSPHFGCPLCRVWSEVPASALGSVIPCPHCGNSIKLNPFAIHADWRPIAAAWKAMANDE